MIAIGDDLKSLYITRGDRTDGLHKLAVQYPVFNFATNEEELYEFQLDDKLAFVVFEKKGYTKEEILRIEKTISEMGYFTPTTTPEIQLTSEDTKKFELKNKQKTYWFDIILNDSTTILGYDEEGGKPIIVYPEAEEGNKNE
nr:MAG TPA: hypothetical protein [Bacteriophage sp.]